MSFYLTILTFFFLELWDINSELWDINYRYTVVFLSLHFVILTFSQNCYKVRTQFVSLSYFFNFFYSMVETGFRSTGIKWPYWHGNYHQLLACTSSHHCFCQNQQDQGHTNLYYRLSFTINKICWNAVDNSLGPLKQKHSLSRVVQECI